MARYSFERLSAQDASFLWAESENAVMHVGAVAVLESGPLRNQAGGIDVERFRAAVEAVLHWIPRYRQKLAWTPVEGWPVWMDDRYFDIGYHIRHLSLPRPGTLAQLKEMSARILARPLDRSRPLWEIWVIEGLEGGEQLALLNKIHHCMIDGAAGADLSQILMSPLPSVEDASPLPYMPRPEPSGSELLADGLRRRVALPVGALRRAAAAVSDGPAAVDGLRRRARALGELVGYALQPASDTPMNGDLSPHRRFDWLTMPLDSVLELRGVLECTVNDLVLATVCGAVRRYLFRRRVDPAGLDFRVAAPVSTRRDEHARRQGNHVSSWIVRLPLAETDPLAQLTAIRDLTGELKRRESALGVETLMGLAEWLPPAAIARGVAMAQGPANVLVTNVPGPQFPLYAVGARLLGLYPSVPLLPGCGLGIALFSYEGKLCWGFNADYELIPDLEAFALDVTAAFEALRAAAVARFMDRRTAPPEREPAADAEVDGSEPVASPRPNGRRRPRREPAQRPGREERAADPGPGEGVAATSS